MLKIRGNVGICCGKFDDETVLFLGWLKGKIKIFLCLGTAVVFIVNQTFFLM